MTDPTRYIFCDIDGTLLYAGKSGRTAFGRAFMEASGVAVDMAPVNFAGATDLGIIADLAAAYDIALSDEIILEFCRLLPIYIEELFKESSPQVFPGVDSFLQRVAGAWNLGLVTGNIRSCALLKLEYGGIGHYFSGIGGFGDDDADRNRMAALALERAGSPEQVFLLGDTPSDIEAARQNGMCSVAVCNGRYDRAALELESPDIIVDSFEEAEHLFNELNV